MVRVPNVQALNLKTLHAFRPPLVVTTVHVRALRQIPQVQVLDDDDLMALMTGDDIVRCSETLP